MNEVKFPKPGDDNGCLFGVLRAVVVAVTAALLSPLIDAVGNVLSFPR